MIQGYFRMSYFSSLVGSVMTRLAEEHELHREPRQRLGTLYIASISASSDMSSTVLTSGIHVVHMGCVRDLRHGGFNANYRCYPIPTLIMRCLWLDAAPVMDWQRLTDREWRYRR